MKENPEISIVILTKNAGHQFRRTLEMIFSQKVDCAFEVVIIDSGSVDQTIALCNEFNVRVKEIKPEEFNFGLTRDLGFEQAKGQYIVTLSQDAIPFNEDWLKRLVAPFKLDKKIAAVQSLPVLPDKKPKFFWEKVGLFYFTKETKRWRERFSFGLSFISAAVRKDVWEANRIGYSLMAEDKIFQRKILNKEYKIVLASESKVYHGHNYNIISLAKRCGNEGIGWKGVSVRYSLLDMFLDILNIKVYIFLIYGILMFKVRSPAEVLFPIVRPVMLYIGNNHLKEYIY